MKKLKFVFLISILLIFNACRKEKIIRESYVPPQPTLFGTWKLINANQNWKDTTYVKFTNDGSNYVVVLHTDSVGFRWKDIRIYDATDKLVNLNSVLYSYKILGDTLSMVYSPTNSTQYVRIKDDHIDANSWTGTITILKSLSIQGFGSLLSFGIDGDYLYVNGYKGYLYKFNTLTEQLEDSLPGLGGSAYYQSPYIYIAPYAQSKILKINGLNLPSADVSLNSIDYPRNISMNSNTSEIFALTNDLKLWGGKEGTTFSQQFDFSKYEIDNAVCYKDAEFLVKKYPCLSRVKIVSGLKVIRSYDPLPDYYIYSASTNGDDTWLFVRRNSDNRPMLLKVRFND